MRYRKAIFLLVGLPVPLFLSACIRTDDLPSSQRWWSHVAVLADDKLEGRKSGSAGYLRAAKYVATEFARLGLEPAGTDGFFQPVPLTSRVIDPVHSSITLVSETGSEPLTLGQEVIVGLQVDPPPMIEAELVFAGYGLSIPEEHYDDFAGLDVKGKLVVFLGDIPRTFSGALAAHIQSPAERAAQLRRNGAIGSLSILNSANRAREWARLTQGQFQPSMMLADLSMNDGRDLKLYLYANPDHADRFFAGSGHSLNLGREGNEIALQLAGNCLFTVASLRRIV